MNAAYTAPPEIGHFQARALIVGATFSAVLLLGTLFEPAQFFHSFLIGFVFWTGVALGCLALLMLQHLTGGAWGLLIRRVLEAGTRTLPLMLLLFLPVLFGLRQIYSWTSPAEMIKSAALAEKERLYLNGRGFILRATVYFGIWLVAAFLLNRASGEHDRTADQQLIKRMRLVSGPGLVILILTITFASIDWVMSLDPNWTSTIFGLLFVASWTLSALALVVAAMALLARHEPMSSVLQPAHFHDLGKLLLTLVMLWAYFAFSQFLIIWSGNLPEETTWYVARTRGGWGAVALAIVILHFGLPFLLLLSRDLKRNARKLALLAVLILIMRIIDLIWLIEPQFNRAHFHLSWMDVVAPIGIGGLWLATFSWQLQKRPLIPINDPQLASALAPAEH
jgi:hypothetical protein